MKEKITEIREALEAAVSHLEYCGYGDSWEREGAEAQKLPERLEKAIKTALELENQL